MALPFIAAALGRTLGAGATRSAFSFAGEAALKKGIGGADAGLRQFSARMNETEKGTRAGEKALTGWRATLDRVHNTATRAAQDIFFFKAALTGLSGKITTYLTMPLDAIAEAAGPFLHLVALAKPGAAQQFTIALEDAYAVIGRIVSGPLDMMTRLTRKLGDTYAKMEPMLTRLSDKLSEVTEKFGEQLIDALEKSIPVIDSLAASLGLISELGTSQTLQAIAGLLDIRRRIFALQGFGGMINPNATSAGAAVRNVTITGSTEEYARKAQEMAFRNASSGGVKAADPQEQAVSWLEEIYNIIPTSADVAQFLTDHLPQGVRDGPGVGNLSGNLATMIAGIAQLQSWIMGARTG